MARVIGQAFTAAYKEFLKSSGISEEALEEAEYAHILNAQSVPQEEVETFSDRSKLKKVQIGSLFTGVCTSSLIIVFTHRLRWPNPREKCWV